MISGELRERTKFGDIEPCRVFAEHDVQPVKPVSREHADESGPVIIAPPRRGVFNCHSNAADRSCSLAVTIREFAGGANLVSSFKEAVHQASKVAAEDAVTF